MPRIEPRKADQSVAYVSSKKTPLVSSRQCCGKVVYLEAYHSVRRRPFVAGSSAQALFPEGHYTGLDEYLALDRRSGVAERPVVEKTREGSGETVAAG
jgi:hypothetical protein